MKNREFRELQVSSTQLAIIFMGILIVDVVIFLLGVSVGKKHAQASQTANVIAQKEPEPVRESFVLPKAKVETEKSQQKMKEETASKPQETAAKQEVTSVVRGSPAEKPKVEPAKEKPKPAPSQAVASPPARTNLYYVQVGALADKPAALSTANRFRSQGYSVVVLDPMSTDKSPVYRVRIGGFAAREEAEAARSKLAAGRKVDYFIVRD
jgi:cell division septation protein DedD